MDKNFGFSQKVMKDKVLQEYISQSYYYGYVGGSARTAMIDKFIEDLFLKTFKFTVRKFVDKFLINSDGRRFVDWLSMKDWTIQEIVNSLKNHFLQ